MYTVTRSPRPYGLYGLRDAAAGSVTADLDALDLTGLQNLAQGYTGLYAITLPNVGTNSPGTITIAKPNALLQFPYLFAIGAAVIGGFIGYKVRQHYS